MREKLLRCVLTFRTTTDALAVEAFAGAHGLPGRLIPVPTALTAGCGMAWCAPADAGEALMAALDAAGLPVAGRHELLV